MLKTTTETGDIGIFSIKPVPPSPQRRGTLSDIGKPPAPPRVSINDLYRCKNSQRFSSNRDTTSEIISMYGTESQKSVTSTLSPTSTEDTGQRSYSMTTCGSRHLSHHKSTATLQSQQSQGSASHLQRPRSPFPYPTRLKRPGVRPASPALTESGRVDYSRMVEIDRISYRTVHGHFRPAFPHVPRKFPPGLHLRADANYSTPSLPLPGPPPDFHGPPPPSVRTRSAASAASWNAPNREGLNSTSSRASSLTSVASLYHRMPPALKTVPTGLTVPAPPRYYDYTEDFESRPARIIAPIQPLAPVPTRASNYRRPLVLQKDDNHLAAVFGENDSAFLNTKSQNAGEQEVPQVPYVSQPGSLATISSRPPSRCRTESIHSRDIATAFDSSSLCCKTARASDIDLLPSQVGRESIDTFNPNLDLESKDMLTYSYSTHRATAAPKTKTNSPERHVQVLGGRVPTIRSEQGVILRDDGQGEPPEGRRSREVEDNQIGKEFSAPGPSRGSERHKARHRTGSTDPANFSSRHAGAKSKSPSALLSREHDLYNPEAPNAFELKRDLNYSSNGEHEGEQHAMLVPPNEAPNIGESQLFRCHRRNQAVMRISTMRMPRSDNESFNDHNGGVPRIAPSCSNAPILSPKPISPARQLKVKNSIPQLMKALPPLPGNAGYVPPSTPLSIGDDDFTEILAPFNFTRRILHDLANKPKNSRSESRASTHLEPDLQKPLPKLRLKSKTAEGLNGPESLNMDKTSSIGSIGVLTTQDTGLTTHAKENSIAPRARTKVKLRSSRSAENLISPISTVHRYPDAEGSGPGAESARQRPHDLLAESKGMTRTSRPISKKLSKLSLRDSFMHKDRQMIASAYGEMDLHKRQESSSMGDLASDLPRTQGTSSDNGSDARQSYGLKQHLSHLRSHFAPSSGSSVFEITALDRIASDLRDEKVGVLESDHGLSDIMSAEKGDAAITMQSTARNGSTPLGRRIHVRLSRWAKGAKNVARKCVRKSHGSEIGEQQRRQHPIRGL
ncbi:hypothetical protein F5Y15DRAFT_422104 [Xylariaceae sp. FL0016]|nr:hypothetical protein F5Y15DRAFT_422104 [Xylariaceae sp. FL0016]